MRGLRNVPNTEPFMPLRAFMEDRDVELEDPDFVIGPYERRRRMTAISKAGVIVVFVAVLALVWALAAGGGRDRTQALSGVIDRASVPGRPLRSATSNTCLDWSDMLTRSTPCDKGDKKQKWQFDESKMKYIETSEGRCLDIGGAHVHVWTCANGAFGGNQFWAYDAAKQHLKDKDGKCLRANPEGGFVSVAACDATDTLQQWSWSLDDPTSTSAAPATTAAPPTAAATTKPKAAVVVSTSQAATVAPQTSSAAASQEAGENKGSSSNMVFIICAVVMALLAAAGLGVALFLAKKRKGAAAKRADSAPPPPGQAASQPPLEPNPNAVAFPDPRPETGGERETPLIAFSYPCREETWDEMCGSAFLGNCYDLGQGGLRLVAQGEERSFRNAEAAFRSLPFWAVAEEFANLDGNEAQQKKQELTGSENFEYAGFGDKWKAMLAVLQAKFKSSSRMASALERTGDAFLLYHNGVEGSDPDSVIWSDGCDGEGANWLGMQLMLIRDRRTGWKKWTTFIESAVDTETGEWRQEEDNTWQDAVRSAKDALVEALAAQPQDQQDPDQESQSPLLQRGQEVAAAAGASEEVASSRGGGSDAGPGAAPVDDDLAKLTAMGFPEDQARQALLDSNGDTERATTMLLSQMDG